MKMDQDNRVLEALNFLSDPDIACSSFYNGTTTESWCCLEVLKCLDMSHFPELFDDVNALPINYVCWYVQSFPGCMVDFPGINFCEKYKTNYQQTFGGYIQILVNKYTENGSCYDDYVTDDYTDWTQWQSTPLPRDPPSKQISELNMSAVVGGIGGAILCVAILLLLVLFICWYRQKKDNRNRVNEPTAAVPELHRGSIDYAVIDDESLHQTRYVQLNLGKFNKGSTHEEMIAANDENDQSIFTIATESPKPGYDGLSSFKRLRMERQYTTLSHDNDCDYIIQPESIPDVPKRNSAQDKCLEDKDHVYFEPRPEPLDNIEIESETEDVSES